MKRIRYIFLAIVIAGILYLTLQSPASTMELSGSVYKWLSEHGIQIEEGLLRSLAHIPEYFCLGIALCLCFEPKTALWSGTLIGFADEILKIFLPTRHFSWFDIGIDIISLVSACVVYVVFSFLIRKFRNI